MKNTNKKGFVLWLTGFSAVGKTTIADRVYELLKEKSIDIERLDGDVARKNFTKKLGFSRADRDENIRRIGLVADTLSRDGVAVVASFITPYNSHREELRNTVSIYIEIFVDAPLEVCEKRDPKGMYKKARLGEIENFTGVSDPYEVPKNPDIHLHTSQDSVEDSVKKIIDFLKQNNHI